MDKHDLGERLLNFAMRIIKLVEALPNTIAGKRIGDQLLRSGTSPGANYEEAQGAESHADFTHKLQIALKEIRETSFWLRVIHRAELLPAPISRVDRQIRTTQENTLKGRCNLKRKSQRIKNKVPTFCLLIFAFCLLISSERSFYNV